MPAYKDNKGRWFVKFYADTWDGTKKQVLKRGFKTKKDALNYEHEYKASKKHSPDITLQTLYNEFKADYKINNRPSSYSVTTSLLDRYVLPYFGNVPIGEITSIHCRKWQNQIKEKDLKKNTLKSIEVCFRKLLNFGVKYYNLPKNPFTILASMGKTTNRQTVITMQEFKAMSENFADVTDKAFFELLFYSGIRLSELRGITKADIDFVNCKIDINKQYLSRGPAPLKTPGSKRIISIPRFVLDDVKTFFEAFAALPEFPFAYISSITVRRRLAKLCDNIGIEPITPHVLRHSHATLLITNNIPINIISKRLGHANITTTLNVYSHCFKDSDSDVVSFLKKVSM